MLVRNTAGVLMLMAALDGANAETSIPGVTADVRLMSKATSAEKSTRACSTTFKIKAGAQAKHAEWLELARRKYSAAYNELVAPAGLDQANCMKAAFNFYCNIRSDEFLELTEQARTKLNQLVPGMKFGEDTFPKECKNRSPL